MPGYWMKWIRFWRRCPTKLFALRFRSFWFGNSDKLTFLGDSHLEPHFNNRKIKPATWNGWMLSRILDEGIASRLPALFIRGTVSRKILISSTLLCKSLMSWAWGHSQPLRATISRVLDGRHHLKSNPSTPEHLLTPSCCMQKLY